MQRIVPWPPGAAPRPLHHLLREAAERRERLRTAAAALAIAALAAAVFWLLPPAA